MTMFMDGRGRTFGVWSIMFTMCKVHTETAPNRVEKKRTTKEEDDISKTAHADGIILGFSITRTTDKKQKQDTLYRYIYLTVVLTE